jgi:hypothetical protein
MSRILTWLLSQPLFWAVVGVVFGPYFFLRGFALLRRKRLKMDIPRSTVRAAALGDVEVSGKAVGPYTVIAPLSHSDCLYYRVTHRNESAGRPPGQGPGDVCASVLGRWHGQAR